MAEATAKQRIWGWYAFDWASQPFYTLLWTFIFSPYFVGVAAALFLTQGLTEDAAGAQAQTIWSGAQTITGLIIAFTAPFMGALADSSGRRRPWVFLFSALVIIGAWGTWFVPPDGSDLLTGLIAFSIGFIGAEFALVFVNSYLPSLGPKEELGRHSGTGFAIGYFGGVLALFLVFVFLAQGPDGKTFAGLDPILGLDPAAAEGTRATGPFVAIWFIVFMIPYFLWVRDNPADARPVNASGVIRDLTASIKKVIKVRSTWAYLVSSMFYRDALNAQFAFGGTYAVLVLNWTIPQIGLFGIIAAISAGVFTWIGGKFDMRFGPKPVIVACLLILILVISIMIGMTREMFFGVALPDGSSFPDIVMYVVGIIVGAAGGVVQAASRTMMVRQANPDRPAEAFGLYAFSGKATAFLAPMLITIFTAATGNVRLGLLPVVLLYVAGLLFMAMVKSEGDAEAWAS